MVTRQATVASRQAADTWWWLTVMVTTVEQRRSRWRGLGFPDLEWRWWVSLGTASGLNRPQIWCGFWTNQS